MLVAPDLVEQHVACDDFVAMPQHVSENFEFARAEVQRDIAATRLACARVEPDIAGAEFLWFVQLRCAAQHGLHARVQFAQGEGLGHVVIGAKFKAQHLVQLGTFRCEHEYRGVHAIGA